VPLLITTLSTGRRARWETQYQYINFKKNRPPPAWHFVFFVLVLLQEDTRIANCPFNKSLLYELVDIFSAAGRKYVLVYKSLEYVLNEKMYSRAEALASRCMPSIKCPGNSLVLDGDKRRLRLGPTDLSASGVP
jgi:hypothetical protein